MTARHCTLVVLESLEMQVKLFTELALIMSGQWRLDNSSAFVLACVNVWKDTAPIALKQQSLWAWPTKFCVPSTERISHMGTMQWQIGGEGGHA